MPIYEYACSACGHRTDILHGVHDQGPAFCPSCGAEGTMRKAFAPPAIVFKGTGWAKKERRSSAGSSTKAKDGDKGTGEARGSSSSDGPTAAASGDGTASGTSGASAKGGGSGSGSSGTSSD